MGARIIIFFSIFVLAACTNPLAPSSSLGSSYLPGLASSNSPGNTLRTNLQAYWNLDEASGARSDSTSNNISMSIWTRTGGSPTIGSTAGILNNSAVFTDSHDWGLRSTSFSQFDITNDFSISAWINVAQHFYDGQVVISTESNFSFIYRPTTGSYHSAMYFYLNTTSGSQSINTPNNSVVQNTWMHVVAVKSGSTYSIYINGTLSATGTFAGTVLPEGTSNFYIGVGSGGYPVNGKIDEVGVWNRALTATEVNTLYNNGSAWSYSLF